MAQNSASTDMELPADEVAARLGLPVGMLVRRIEAGDIPARREDSSGEPRYLLRLSDLGITAEEAATFQSNQEQVRSGGDGGTSLLDADDDPLGAVDAVELAGRAASGAATSGSALPRAPGADPEAGDGPSIDDSVPPPGASRTPDVAIRESPDGPRGELAAMTIDPRELVAGLLDRWEHTLEQRIYAEQRQRFEAELTNRLHQVKELQGELHATRAEHAAAQAEKDRELAAKERELADQERALAKERSRPKRRGWFSRIS